MKKKEEIIVLVDDNPTAIFYNRDILSDMFTDRQIFSYENPQQFLREFLSGKFEQYAHILLLLDLNMPYYSGYEILEEIEDEIEDLDNLQVVLLTSSRLKSDLEKSERFYPVIGYIEKPLQIPKLQRVLVKTES